ncbi:glycosyltransferase [[Haemophilus] ducreyi]|uniref:glycosyltransferase n=1 Tax=Haemophilus ducreyi TaxID=730 RepID=UPI001AD80812
MAGKWKQYNIFDKSVKIIKDLSKKLQYQDQDILNLILKDKVLLLDCRYNFMPSQLDFIKRDKVRKGIKITTPIVIYHYCGPKKPWHIDCTNFNCELYAYLSNKLQDKPAHWS